MVWQTAKMRCALGIEWTSACELPLRLHDCLYMHSQMNGRCLEERELPLSDRDYVRGNHPAACTCVECSQRRMGRSQGGGLIGRLFKGVSKLFGRK